MLVYIIVDEMRYFIMDQQCPVHCMTDSQCRANHSLGSLIKYKGYHTFDEVLFIYMNIAIRTCLK